MSTVVPTSPQPGQGRSLTRLGVWFVVSALVLIALGLLRDGVWLFLLAMLLLVSVAASWVAAPRLGGINLSVRRPGLEVAGGPTRFTLTFDSERAVLPHRIVVTPEGAEPAVLMHGGSEPGEAVSCDIDIHGARRGTFRLMRVAAGATTPFGLVRMRHVVDVALPRCVVPTPLQVRVDSGRARDLQGAPTSTYRLSRSGDDLHGVRPWSPGDGAAVHWRSTLRRGSPMVVERETALGRSLVVLLAADPASPGFEPLVAQVAGVLLAARHDDARVRLLIEGGGFDATAAATEEILARLAALPRDLRTPTEATVAAALDLAGPGGRLVAAHTRPEPWVVSATTAGIAAEVEVLPLSCTQDAVRPERAAPPLPQGSGRVVRAAATVSTLAGLAALTLSGLVPAAVAAACTVVLVATAVVAQRPTVWQRHRLARQIASAVAVVVAFAAGALEWSSGDQFTTLALALSLLSVAHGFAQDTRRDVLVGLGLGPLMVIAAAGLAPGPALALPTVVAWVAVLVGLTGGAAETDREDAAAVAMSAETLPLPGSTPATPVHWRPLLMTAVVATAVVSFLLLPLGAAPMVRESLLAGAGVGSRPDANSPADNLDFLSGDLDLDARGPLPDNPMVQVRSGGPTLWRGFVLDTVSDGQWTASRRGGRTLAPDADGVITLPAGETTPTAGAVSAFEVRPAPGVNLPLLAPGAAQSVRGLGLVQQIADDAAFDVSETPWQQEYTITASIRPDLDSVDVTDGGADPVDPVWVQQDPSTTARTVELARSITAGIGDRAGKVRAVETWLRTNATYLLDAPRAPAGQGPVDYFLFDSREGFCQHFAAAEAALLRAVGIPSRLAVGFLVTPSSEDRDGWSTAQGTDAHAWVEVWLPSLGWVSSDPTAGTQLAEGGSGSVLDRISSVFTSMWSTDASRRLLALAVAAIAALVVLAAGLRRRRLRASARGGSSGSVAGRTTEPIAAFLRLRAALGHDVELGPADGVDEVRRRAVLQPDVLAALDVVARCLYAGSPVATDDRLRAADVLDRWTATVLADPVALVSP